MPDRPKWMDYADLASKWAVPIAVFAGTALLGYCNTQNQKLDKQLQDRSTKLQACIDKQFQLADFACRSGDCGKLSDGQATKLVDLAKFVAAVCDGTDFPITQSVGDQVRTAAATTNDVALAAEAASAVGSRQTTVVPSAAEIQKAPRPIEPSVSVGTSEAANPAPRLYVQISEPTQRDPAKALIARLDQASFQGRQLNALGPDLRPINRTQLRCVTRADCGSAQELASYISSVLGEPVPVVNLSATYERRTNTRASHYELWIAPGEIRVAGTSPRVSSVQTLSPAQSVAARATARTGLEYPR